MIKTFVVYRKFDGEIIALFPAITATYNPDDCQSYQHIGQHGAATFGPVMRNSKPASQEEYQLLHNELVVIGYENLVVLPDVDRSQSKVFRKQRVAELRKI